MGREIKIEYLVIYEDKPTTRTVFTLEQIEQGIMTIGSALGAVANGVKEIHRRQSTGFFDADKNEIFEDDIICNEGIKERVFWDELYGWCVSEEQMLHEVNFARIKVVGNFHENKELLDV